MKPSIIITAAIFVVTAQAYTEEQQKRLEQISAECVKESNVDPAVLKEAEHGNLQDDAKLKKHAFCFAKKIQLQNEKGDLLSEKVKERLSKQMKDAAEVDRILKLCLIQKGTPEESAWLSLKCFQANTSPKNVAVF